MAFQPCPDVINTEVRMALRGVPVECVLDWVLQPAAPPDPAAVQDCAENLLAHWTAEIMPFLGGNLTLLSVKATDLTVEGGATFEAAASPPVDGGTAGESLPNSVALCYTKRTSRAGRSYRGRTYLPGLVEAQVNGNFLASGVGATLGPIMGNLASAMETSGFDLVVLSRRNGGAARPTGISTAMNSVVLLTELVDSQLGRMPDE